MILQILKVKSCCCCMNLTTGTKLVGFITLEKAKFIPWWLVSTLVIAILEVVLLPTFILRFATNLKYFTLDLQLMLICLFMTLDDVYGLLVVFSYYRTVSPPSDVV
uniref:Uncharacterized protein n=1 Tax=Graphocephala atropunctata TaxID=36148 RepID=A0A1B6MC17_9HEMI